MGLLCLLILTSVCVCVLVGCGFVVVCWCFVVWFADAGHVFGFEFVAAVLCVWCLVFSVVCVGVVVFGLRVVGVVFLIGCLIICVAVGWGCVGGYWWVCFVNVFYSFG